MRDDDRPIGSGRESQAEETDDLELRTRDTNARRSDVQQRLTDAIAAVHFTDERGAAAYRKALDDLRETGDDLRTAVSELEISAANDHGLRWTLYYVLADLELGELTPIFVTAAVRELPEITDETPCETVDDDEILVSVMAVEGLARLARRKLEGAIGSLLEVIERQPHISIRTVAIQAILSVQPDAADELAHLLPEEQRYLLDMRRSSIEQLTALSEEVAPKRAAVRGPKLASDVNTPKTRESEE